MKKILLLGLMGLMGLFGSRAHGQMIIDMWNMTTGVDTTLWYDISGVDSVIITPGNKTSARAQNIDTSNAKTQGCDDTISTFPWSEGFENNLPACWNTNINGTGFSWECETGTSYAHTGNRSLTSNIPSGTKDWLMMPAIEVPTAGSLSLDFWVNFAVNGSNVTLTVLVSTTGRNATTMFTDTLLHESNHTYYPNLGYHNTYVPRSISLDDYAGQTIWVAFVNGGTGCLMLDDLSIDVSGLPVVGLTGPGIVRSSDAAVFQATLLSGDSTGLTYTWHSDMVAAGSATANISGSRMVIDYLGAGNDVITVIATNAVGSDTASTTCSITDCEPISRFPYIVALTSDDSLDCWDIRNYIPGNEGFFNRWTIGSFLGSGYVCMTAESGFWRETSDAWLVMREIDIPDDSESYFLEWHGLCDHARYTVLASTTSRTDTNAFADTLYAETSGASSWATHSVSLDAFRGQHVHIAFRSLGWNNTPANYSDIGVVRIDTVKVLRPSDTIQLPPSPDTVWRTVTVFCDSTMGSVSGGGTYMDSSMVTITATANDGYHFTSWNDGDTHAVRTLTLVSDTAFTAHFAVDTLPTPPTPDTVWRTVTVHMLLDNGDTLFEADVVSVTGAGSYPDSTLVTLTAYYDNYYPYFWYWVTPANDTLYDNPYSFVVTSDTVINAIFGPMCVGIDGTESAAPDVFLHPNPATGDAYVSVGVPSTVTVVDLQGRTVLQPTRVASTLCLQQGTLPKGIYFVSVSNSVGTVVKKLVIQ